MRMRKITALISSLSISSLGLLLPFNIAQAAETCEGGECEVVFNKTEQVETWVVPDAVTELEFEVYGAQGGANGGRGGFVSGTLSNLPAEITLVVGGEGARGANLNGGYNGGGYSGGRDGNPGSGGGASDIRFGSDLTDRVIVAGGGGGFGGPVGGAGGAGGGESASDGSAGQGGAGAGGSQVSGGAGGRSNSGNTNGASGRFGIGGEGGYTFSGYGGGGGGGGYFGGGGGGADTDTCCLDAGGGGGGSSFADPSYASNVVFQPGFQAGDGKIILRYSLPPSITEFSYQQLAPLSVEVSLILDSDATGIDVEDFIVTGCLDKSIVGNGSNYTLALDNCEAVSSVLVEANSLGSGSNFPTEDQLLQLELDQIGPAATFSAPELINKDSFELLVETDGGTVVDGSEISSTECQWSDVVDGNRITVFAADCPEGEVSFVFGTGFIKDSIGNQAFDNPRTINVLVDLTAPEVSVGESVIEEISFEGERVIQTQTPLNFNESLPSFEDFLFSGNERCSISHQLDDLVMTLVTEGCASGEVSWTLPAESLQDSAGNLSPTEDLVVQLQIPEIQPLPEPAPEVVQPPVEQPAPAPIFVPTPQPDPTPIEDVDSGPDISAPAEDEQLESDPQPESEQTLEPENDGVSDQQDSDQEVLGGESEIPTVNNEPVSAEPQSAEIESQESDVQSEGAQVDPEAEDEPQTEDYGQTASDLTSEQALPASQYQQAQESTDELIANPWTIGLASFLVLGLLTGVVYLTKNNRSRSIE